MDENRTAEIEKRYFELFPIELPWEEVASRLNQHEDDTNIEEFRSIFVNGYMDMLLRRNYAYNADFFKSDAGRLILDQFFKMHYSYYSAFAYYLTGNNKLCLKLFKNFLENLDLPDGFNWEWFAVNIIPFRDAFPEFWSLLKEFLRSNNSGEKYLKLVDAIEYFYTGNDIEIMINTLSDSLVLDTDNLLVHELLGISYYYNGDWRNAISYLENLDDCYVLMYDDLYFMLAWSYGKIKDHKNEISWYEKCVELNPEKQYASNNLGYAYYKNKEFEKSEQILKQCIAKKIDLKYVSANYVNTLLASGKIEEARKFVKDPPVKLPKYVTDKVSNYKPKKESDTASDTTNTEQQTEIKIQKNKVKPLQFSNEKILEDELTSRLEKGENVFGMPLHIYNHKGERYGRQYIIPVGRLDLLAEDNEGNLYIIELKKDSGYGDVYSQIRSYIHWFEKNKKEKSCKVYGIICLNGPDKNLIEKIKQDDQVRLFEYAITYTEYK